jgi:hypothetical protein
LKQRNEQIAFEHARLEQVKQEMELEAQRAMYSGELVISTPSSRPSVLGSLPPALGSHLSQSSLAFRNSSAEVGHLATSFVCKSDDSGLLRSFADFEAEMLASNGSEAEGHYRAHSNQDKTKRSSSRSENVPTSRHDDLKRKRDGNMSTGFSFSPDADPDPDDAPSNKTKRAKSEAKSGSRETEKERLHKVASCVRGLVKEASPRLDKDSFKLIARKTVEKVMEDWGSKPRGNLEVTAWLSGKRLASIKSLVYKYLTKFAPEAKITKPAASSSEPSSKSRRPHSSSKNKTSTKTTEKTAGTSSSSSRTEAALIPTSRIGPFTAISAGVVMEDASEQGSDMELEG